MTPWSLSDPRPEPGQPVDDLETPVLTVDVDAMERNVEEYAAVAEANDVTLRSHVKTHKNAELARYEDRVTGGGVCCQTLGEVEVMARGGVDDVYLSYQVVGDRKLRRLCHLNEKLDSFATTVDGPENADALAAAAADHDTVVDTIVEVDVGVGRTGVRPGQPTVDIVERVARHDALNFQGLLCYESHVKGQVETEAEFEEYCWEAMEVARETVEAIEDAGFDVPEVKVGGTATARYSARHPVVTEINPGMYPFNDVGELELRPWEVSKADCAATVRTTVISTPEPGRAVVDGGSKTFGVDKPQYPVPKHRDDIEYVNASEEHGWLDVSEAEEPVEVGDVLEFIVPHVCTTVNLHDFAVGVRDGEVADLWEVEARGMVR